MLIACSIDIAISSFDTFGSYIAAGFAVLFSIQILINISMTIGLIPITGLTLPFISYGGSSIMTNIMSVGLINSIGRSR
jgi:cell division protein FtsW (lipid II flippase)